MNENQVSITALVCAFTRAYHSENDSPKIFDDFLAASLFPPDEKAFFAKHMAGLLKMYDPDAAKAGKNEEEALRIMMQVFSSSTILSRSRFTEDCLEQSMETGMGQYVILGAGFDTFTLRRPDLAHRLKVFEVDHPATQANKRERFLRINPTLPVNLHFIPLVFGKDDLKTALLEAGYDPLIPGFFSWLGVTYYLEQDEIQSTLETISRIAVPGSSLVFDYSSPGAFQPNSATRRDRATQSIARQAGETMKTSFDPLGLESLLLQNGFETVQNLSPVEIEDRYFSGRKDRYHAFEYVHLIQSQRK